MDLIISPFELDDGENDCTASGMRLTLGTDRVITSSLKLRIPGYVLYDSEQHLDERGIHVLAGMHFSSCRAYCCHDSEHVLAVCCVIARDSLPCPFFHDSAVSDDFCILNYLTPFL